MEPFEVLDHTADMGFRARGTTLEELFENAALALIHTALDASRAAAYAPRQLTAGGEAREELLVNWLNEVLYLLDAERFVPARFEAIWFDGDSVFAQIIGERRDDQRHPPRIVVKAATYHQLRVEEHNGQWEAEVCLDI
ncbi:MAG: archease [Acidobacteria bacterium]|nr:archease [Acidobacteriota bacterium]